MGITYFDTAPSYNNGQSETNYGPVVARRRGELFLATKTGDRSYDGTRRSIEQSLRRLRTDHVDLLQIHGVSDRDDLEAWGKPDGVVSALRKLRDEKVIRFLGVTGHDSADALRRAIEMYEFDTLLTTLNPVSRRRPYPGGVAGHREPQEDGRHRHEGHGRRERLPGGREPVAEGAPALSR